MGKPSNGLGKAIEKQLLERFVGTVIENIAARVDEVAVRKLKEPSVGKKIEELTDRLLNRILRVI